ncbi:MAG: hypothetical protein ACKVWV_09510 [Planctomycetota bacterium]
MRNIIGSVVIAALALGPAQAAATHALDRASLHAASASALADMRAGAPALRASPSAPERTALRAAQRESTALRTLRAGEMSLSDRDLTIIAIVVVVVILIIAIA